MTILTEMIKALAAFLVTVGFPADRSTLYALIFIYLLATGALAVLLLVLLLRRRRAVKRTASPPDPES